jgi:ABC-type Na+ transport system ATPase subunit NatA
VTVVVKAESLTKRFGEVSAVTDLSFSLEAGTITGYLGPNGAGKTTTLRMTFIACKVGCVLTAGHIAEYAYSRLSTSARLGTTKDARKIGKNLLPVHRKATVSPSVASKV